jgi:acetate---CoA ligase (ADP-forming)
MNLHPFFYAKNIAIVGVSTTPSKVGHVIFKNFQDNKFHGNVYPVNPRETYILETPCYKNILKIKAKLDLVIIAIPAPFVLTTLKQCAKKNVHHVVLVTAGFSEVGNTTLENQVKNYANKHNIKIIGPNCLGVYNGYTKLDSLFLPRYKLQRPDTGPISFITQSGAVGSALMDVAAAEGIGFAKFISYGNAMNVDEADILEYLGKDKDTKIICMYLETAKHGRKFLEIAKKIKKPIIALKGGRTMAGNKAALSHTASLAGSALIYKGVFRQANIIQADDPQDVFAYAQILQKCPKPKGKNVAIITDGGGYGILCTDEIEEYGLHTAELSQETEKLLKTQLPSLASIHNPIDLVGDATTKRYQDAMEACMSDKNVDIILIALLLQVPRLTDDIVGVITTYSKKKKPIVCVATGAEYTKVLSRRLHENGVAIYQYPRLAVKSIKKLVEFYD